MTGWTVTGLAARAANALGARARWLSPAAVATAAGLAQRGPRKQDSVFARVSVRRIAASSPADRKALEAALSTVAGDREVIQRAIASGAPISAVAGLAARWENLSDSARTMVRSPLPRASVGPVKLGGVSAKQVDQTTCGAASLALMAMITDPFVSHWVATGNAIADYLPPEAFRAEIGGLPAHTIADRWNSLQRSLHHTVTRTAIGPFPWPRSLGTPPWRVDNVARCAGVRMRGFIVDDAKPDDIAAVVAHASAALRDGIPVPLYVGGDSSIGLDAVVPRHVVLLVGRDGDLLHVYEPGSGAVHELPLDGLSQPHGRLAAFGNWNRLEWCVLPTPRT